MATRQNHRKRHATIEGRADAILDVVQTGKARRRGFPATPAGVCAYLHAQAAEARREKRLAQQARDDAAWLVAQHVNTAPPPMRRVHPGQDICRGYITKPVLAIVPIRETPPEVADFIRRFRVAHSNDVDALDALIREVAA